MCSLSPCCLHQDFPNYYTAPGILCELHIILTNSWIKHSAFWVLKVFLPFWQKTTPHPFLSFYYIDDQVLLKAHLAKW